MKKRLLKIGLYLGITLAIALCALVLLTRGAFAQGQAQPIVELQNNWNSGITTPSGFKDQSISGTDNSTKQQYKFQRQRKGIDFSYVIANLTPYASYSVELSFVEHDFSQVDKRVFNAYLQNTKVINGLDIYKMAGSNGAYQRTINNVADSGGRLTIEFRSWESGCTGEATISTIRVYSGSGTVVEINAAASRNNMTPPVRHTNSGSQNALECILGRLGSRLSLNLLPQRLAARFSSLGTGTGDLSDLILATSGGGQIRCLPFTDRFPVWESVNQSQTMTTEAFDCSSPSMPLRTRATFRAPFYPRNEKISEAPFVYVDVTVTNAGGSPASGAFLLAWPQRQDFSSSAVTQFSTAAEKGFTYNTSYTYYDESINPAASKSATEALALPVGEAGADVVFKGPNPLDFSDFGGDHVLGWNSPYGYPQTYNDPANPTYAFYPRGYSGAEWTITNLAPGASSTKHFVLAGYVADNILTVKNSAYQDNTYKFKYKQQFSSVLNVVDYAVTSRSAGDTIEDKSSFFDSTVSSYSYLSINTGHLDDIRNLMASSFQSFLANTWWAVSAYGREWFSVWEGIFRYHSTIDVEYNDAWFYFQYWPELLKKILDEWPLYAKYNDQGMYLSHDMGWGDYPMGQSYPFDMPVEENTNYILLLYKYWKTTGDTSYVNQRFGTVRQLVDFLINCDTNNNGLPDINTFNTLDDGSPGLKLSKDQTYLGVKCLAACNAVHEMAGALSVPDIAYASKSAKQVELINQTLDYDLWLSDHFAVCLDGNINDADRTAYSIYPTNGLLYLLGSTRSQGVTSSNIAKMQTDLAVSTWKTMKAYGCTHTTFNPFVEWVSENLWRDQAAFQLGTILQAEDPLGFDSRYWSLQKFFGTTLNGTYWDGVIYPGGSGVKSVSAQSNPLMLNGEEGSAAGFQQNLGYYPRGTASLGLPDAVAGLILDVPGGGLFFQPQVYPLRVPVPARADWGNADPAARVPTLYFPAAWSAPTIANAQLLPGRVGFKQILNLSGVSAGGHAISPNGDGVNDSTTVSYGLPVSASVDASIWEGAEQVRTYARQAKAAGSGSFTWDGKTNSGQVLPDGLYTARMDSYPDDSTFQLRPASAPVWVNSSVPDLSTDWYLAEGFTGQNATGGNFEEYVLLQNPNNEAAKFDVTFMLPGGQTVKGSYQTPPNSRYTITVNQILPNAEVSTYVHSDKRVAVERAMYFNGRRAGHDSIGVTSPGNTWYLAEGYTGPGWDDYVLIQNPGDKTAGVTATFMTPGAGNPVKSYNVGPHSRFTIHVNDIVPNQSVSTKIESSEPVVVERAQYLNKMTGGTSSIGAKSTSRTWYLAEGYTAQGFEEWVLIQNPGNTTNNVNVTYMDNSGANTLRSYSLPPACRFTILVNELLPASEVSVKVRAQNPVIVERAMYWNNRSDGHDCIGTPTPDTAWYLPEGYTAQGFETWILIENPADDQRKVTLTFMEPSGKNTVKSYAVPPRSRFTVGVNDILPSTEMSTRVNADGPIIVERAVYFNNRSGGTDSLGVRGY
jgi:hypothetical protein